MKAVTVFLNIILVVAAVIFWANIIYNGRLDDAEGMHLQLLFLMTITPAMSVYMLTRK